MPSRRGPPAKIPPWVFQAVHGAKVSQRLPSVTKESAEVMDCEHPEHTLTHSVQRPSSKVWADLMQINWAAMLLSCQQMALEVTGGLNLKTKAGHQFIFLITTNSTPIHTLIANKMAHFKIWRKHSKCVQHK